MNTSEKIQLLIAEENRWLQKKRGPLPDKYIQRVKTVDAGGEGDCFYYSLYETLRNSNLKDRVDKAYKTAGTKGKFVSLFRVVVARNAEQDLTELYHTICSAKTDGSHYNSSESFQGFLNVSGNPEWLNGLLLKTFGKYDSHSNACTEHTPNSAEVREFIQQGKNGMTKRGNYVGQIEVAIAQRLLRDLDIYLDIKLSDTDHLLHIDNRIALWNIDEGHYRYFKPINSSVAAPDLNNAVTVVSSVQKSIEPPSVAPATPAPATPAPIAPASAKPVPAPVAPASAKPVPAPVAPVPAPAKPAPAPVAPVPAPAKPAPVAPAKPVFVQPSVVAKTSFTPRNRKNTTNRTQKIHRQMHRVYAAYQYVLDEVQKLRDVLDKSNSYYMKN